MEKQQVKEDLNHVAYMDVLDCKDPRFAESEEYMKAYRFWRQLQRFPGDDIP